jgi:hypothetical protein
MVVVHLVSNLLNKLLTVDTSKRKSNQLMVIMDLQAVLVVDKVEIIMDLQALLVVDKVEIIMDL